MSAARCWRAAVAVTVLSGAVGCGAAAGSGSASLGPARQATAVDTAMPKYRMVRPALVIVYVTSDAPYFQVRVRMNRALPTDRQGVKANFLVGTSGSDAPPVPFGRRTRHCYATVVGNDGKPDPTLAAAKPGVKVPVAIRVVGQRSLTQIVTLRSNHGGDVAGLGCGKR